MRSMQCQHGPSEPSHHLIEVGGNGENMMRSGRSQEEDGGCYNSGGQAGSGVWGNNGFSVKNIRSPEIHHVGGVLMLNMVVRAVTTRLERGKRRIRVSTWYIPYIHFPLFRL
jgi:hypothetical protein